MKWILLVEDDLAVARSISRVLEARKFGVVIGQSIEEARELVSTRPFSVVLLDLQLQNDYAFDLARDLIGHHTLPVIFVSASDDVLDKVVALELGAFDYIVKPFDDRELIARIRTALRFCASTEDSQPGQQIYQIGSFRVDLLKRAVTEADGTEVGLSRFEFQLLKILVVRNGHLVTRDQISLKVNRRPHNPLDRTIDVVVAKLRSKLDASIIETVRGEGYRLGVVATLAGDARPGNTTNVENEAAPI